MIHIRLVKCYLTDPALCRISSLVTQCLFKTADRGRAICVGSFSVIFLFHLHRLSLQTTQYSIVKPHRRTAIDHRSLGVDHIAPMRWNIAAG